MLVLPHIGLADTARLSLALSSRGPRKSIVGVVTMEAKGQSVNRYLCLPQFSGNRCKVAFLSPDVSAIALYLSKEESHARSLVRVFRFSDRKHNRTAQATYTPKRCIDVKCNYCLLPAENISLRSKSFAKSRACPERLPAYVILVCLAQRMCP